MVIDLDLILAPQAGCVTVISSAVVGDILGERDNGPVPSQAITDNVLEFLMRAPHLDSRAPCSTDEFLSAHI